MGEENSRRDGGGGDAKGPGTEPPNAMTIVEHSDEEHDACTTATESYDDLSGDENSQASFDGKPNPMPPLKYARIMGALPRSDDASAPALTVKITSSAMGRVVVRPSQTSEKTADAPLPSGSRHGEGANASAGDIGSDYDDDEADMSMTKVHHVLALGFEDGKVRLVDSLTGGSVLFGSTSDDGGAWYVNPSAAKRGKDPGHKIVALSFDSSSTYLSAMNANGDAAIFGPLVWGKQSRRSTVGGEGQHKFGFLSPFGGKEPEASDSTDRNLIMRPSYALTKPPASTVWFTYADPHSFGASLLGGGASPDQVPHPTCMALDPAYSRRKERAIVVGFDDGRLVLSKLQGAAGIGTGISSFFGGGGGNAAAGGGTTVKKIDAVLYQGTGAASYSGGQAGIEAVSWRGGLVAWADSSGVRLFDIESMSRIAHIDRPTGARSSLYPTISSMRPSLLFERSDSLLIGWGDCLMAMQVRDVQSSKPSTKDGASGKEVKRKTVTVTMAWELDCVACSVVPVDERHVAVLGLAPSPSLSNESDASSEQIARMNTPGVAGGDNLLELQIINRVDGKSISSDRLPLLEGSDQHRGDQCIVPANAAEFCLLSSFAVARMDSVAEWEALDEAEKESVRRELGFDSQSSSIQELPDLHSRWNIGKDICHVGKEIQSEAADYDDQSVASSYSVCSDNYVFVLSEPLGDIMPDTLDIVRTTPPIMTVIYSYDACLVQTRDVDDVISYTRSLGKPALALKQALAHRREVRRHGLDQLVDEHFVALLRMGHGKQKPLSLSRLKIATESLPILLGGDSRMWQRWIFMFSRIPGGLFIIREKIPVRDPDLPAFVFEMCLEKMLQEAVSSRDEGKGALLEEKMADLYLETMRSWGPTSALRQRIQLKRYCAQSHWHSVSGSSVVTPFIRQAERDLHRRISQTAFGVLADAAQQGQSSAPGNSIRQYIDSSEDSLFDVDHLIARLVTRLQVSSPENNAGDDSSPNVVFGDMKDGSSVVVESMAELELMRERFDRALGYYLAIGSHFMAGLLPSLEEAAVQQVNSHGLRDAIPLPRDDEKAVESDRFGHVLSMVELHQLHRVLLKRNYFFDEEKADAAAESPIVALIMLVGLSRARTFLIDCCSPPEGTTLPVDSDEVEAYDVSTAHSGSNLPIDSVAQQLKSRPKLLYWFLFQVFVHKPDIYVKFPTTAVPPQAITDLHRIQFALFVDYAGEGSTMSQSGQSLAGMAIDKDTPFISFLRAALPHGGVQADNVRTKLESYRAGASGSPVFARELAFVIETFGQGSMEDAKEILQLYLQGAKNLFLAVAFAQRSAKYSSALWDVLVEHCTTPDPANGPNQNSALGARFGALLEAAAHTGADLASLVSRIPEGMSIEGLRPKLIGAITDYRYKVKIHEEVDHMLMEDKVSILRELSHLSRRGERIEAEDEEGKQSERTAGHSQSSRVDRLRSWRSKGPAIHEHAFSLPIR